MKVTSYFGIALFIILLDQSMKLWVYFSYTDWPYDQYGEHELMIFNNWFRLRYLLNAGMAFGIRFQNEYGKLLLTLCRIIAVGGIVYYLLFSVRQKAHIGFLICLSLILGGALGNVIDSTFYGVLLNNAPPESPTPWFHGQVIDMFFFPLFEFVIPYWIPFVGGEHFLFFNPVFNVADSSIFIGVAGIIIFQKKFFFEHHQSMDQKGSVSTTEPPVEDGLSSTSDATKSNVSVDE